MQRGRHLRKIGRVGGRRALAADAAHIRGRGGRADAGGRVGELAVVADGAVGGGAEAEGADGVGGGDGVVEGGDGGFAAEEGAFGDGESAAVRVQACEGTAGGGGRR